MRARVPTTIPPVLPVRFFGPRGVKELDALVDTGSTYVILSPDDAADLGYTLRRTRTVPVITAGGIIHAPLLTVSAIMVLGFRRQRIPTLVKDVSSSGIEPILGWSFLNRYRLTIDARRHWCELAD